VTAAFMYGISGVDPGNVRRLLYLKRPQSI
jgi:hypothetical protein